MIHNIIHNDNDDDDDRMRQSKTEFCLTRQTQDKHKTKKALRNPTHPTPNPITQDKKTKNHSKPFNMLSPPKEK